jgi:hypothetical protein
MNSNNARFGFVVLAVTILTAWLCSDAVAKAHGGAFANPQFHL